MAEIDEAAIRQEIEGRRYTITIDEDWLTPAGNPRRLPLYFAHIENDYLGIDKRVTGRTQGEVETKARKQIETWARRELRERVGAAKADLREAAREAADKAKQELEAIEGILAATLDFDDQIDWQEMKDLRVYGKATGTPRKPRKPQTPSEPEPPKKGILDRLLPFLWKRKEEASRKEHEAWEEECQDLERRWRQAVANWDKAREEFEAAQAKVNEGIDRFRERFEAGEPDAIIEYVNQVFENSTYPDGFPVDRQCSLAPDAETVVVDLAVPAPSELPDTVDFKLKDRGRRMEPVRRKPKETEALYDTATKQAVLRTLHEVFEALYTSHVQSAVVNAWTTVTNAATGHDETSCIVSVAAERTEFEKINLARVDPTECIKGLKGLIAGPLAQIPPVRPILQLDTDDPRFVESKDVLADFNAKTNLAAIPWEEFEHLVRELFAKLVSGEGAEVRVTQASRDAGVDAIAFDPDPIRGGKFVIQAKRYNNVVPVSAVRDLYGTMINEGAAKGILVTTSYYGRDARGFAKDKPITLIDGSNLVHLLEEHGHQVRISLKERV